MPNSHTKPTSCCITETEARFRFLKGMLAALYELRADAKVLIHRQFERLLNSSQTLQTHEEPQSQDKSSWFKALRGRAHVLILFCRAFLGSWGTLRRIDNLNPRELAVVVALSSGRLASEKVNLSPKEYLSRLVSQSFSTSPPQSEVSAKILTTKLVFVFEPERISPWRRKLEDCQKDHVYVVDSLCLFAAVLKAVLNFRAKNAWFCFRHRRQFQRLATDRFSRDNSFRSIFLSALLLDGYHELLGKFSSLEGIFLTSNSFTTEILRFYLLQASHCASVCEVMHGVPTLIYERYLALLLKAGERFHASDKHSSLSQLPHLETFGVLTCDVKVKPEVAINTNLNKYLLEVASDEIPLLSSITRQLETLLLGNRELSNELIIISFIGGATAEKEFLSSRLFRMECFILETVCQALEELKKKYYLLYFPHPSRCSGAPADYRDLLSQELFKSQKVVIHPQTVFSWFISDVAMGTFSGALFESAFFGATTFAPMAVGDLIYPKILLDRLHYQTDSETEDLTITLRKFVQEKIPLPSSDVYQRLSDRLELLNDIRRPMLALEGRFKNLSQSSMISAGLNSEAFGARATYENTKLGYGELA